jgi:tripartite ATP-independent transporter DctM subunit
MDVVTDSADLDVASDVDVVDIRATRPLAPDPHPSVLTRITGALALATAMIAMAIAIIAGLAIFVVVFGNILDRELLNGSIYGAEEFSRFAFLWLIWMGVALAVRRSAVTVLTIGTDNGPWWWRASLRGLAMGSLGILLTYACWQSIHYVLSQESVQSISPAMRVPMWTAILSMPVGYAFIAIQYLHIASRSLDRVRRSGPDRWRAPLAGVAGGLILAAVLWVVCFGLLSANVAPLIPLAIVFVSLTLAGMPVVFMLSLVGILGATSFLWLDFFPFAGADPLFPFRTTQNAMGLSSGGELVVIYLFLMVAELMNGAGLSQRLIRFAASLVGHFRGGMAFVCQITSAVMSGISGSAQADAAVMTPLLVPAMEKEGYDRDVAAAVVAGASIKGPVGPISVMFIAYGYIVSGPGQASINQMLASGVVLVLGLLLLQGAVVSIVARRRGMTPPHPFLGWREVGVSGLGALPILMIPVIIIGGILSGYFTPTESASVALAVTVVLALAFRRLSIPVLGRAMIVSAIETGIVMLLLGDSAILANLLYIDGFGQSIQNWATGLTSNADAFLLLVMVLMLLVGIFIEPLPALYMFAPFLAPVAVTVYNINPVQFAMVVVLALVIGLIHPPVGLVLFLVSSISKVRVERLSVTILPWIGVSLIGLLLVAYLPADVLLWFSNHF